MSIGVAGPLSWEMAVHYAVVTAIYPLAHPACNKLTVGCKLCGKRLEPGEARPYGLLDEAGPRASSCYLCSGCVAWWQAHFAAWHDFKGRRAAEQRTDFRPEAKTNGEAQSKDLPAEASETGD